MEPLYEENIVVVVKYHNKYQWYISDLDYWFVDYDLYDNSHVCHERQASRQLNPGTIRYFLEEIEPYHWDTLQLRQGFNSAYFSDPLNARYDYKPSLFIDLDDYKLFSQYAESISFEEYVSDPWIGECKLFLDLIPESDRFWSQYGDNVFEQQ